MPRHTSNGLLTYIIIISVATSILFGVFKLAYSAPEGPSSAGEGHPHIYKLLASGDLEANNSVSLPTKIAAGHTTYLVDVQNVDQSTKTLNSEIEILGTDGKSVGIDPVHLQVSRHEGRFGLSVRVPQGLSALLRISNGNDQSVHYWLYSMPIYAVLSPPFFGSYVPQPLVPGHSDTGEIGPDQQVYIRARITRGLSSLVADLHCPNGSSPGIKASIVILDKHGLPTGINEADVQNDETDWRFGTYVQSQEPDYVIVSLYNSGQSALDYAVWQTSKKIACPPFWNNQTPIDHNTGETTNLDLSAGEAAYIRVPVSSGPMQLHFADNGGESDSHHALLRLLDAAGLPMQADTIQLGDNSTKAKDVTFNLSTKETLIFRIDNSGSTTGHFSLTVQQGP